MSVQDRHRSLAVLLSIVPGWGHIYWGRERLGLAVFTVSAVTGFAWINGRFLYQGSGGAFLEWGAASLFLLLWAGSVADVVFRSRPERVRRQRERVGELLDQGTIAYLHSDEVKAQRCFQEALQIAPEDSEVMFRLGVVASRAGDLRAARKWLRATLRYDLAEKWDWEVRRELRRISSRLESEPPSVSRQQEEAEKSSA